MIDFIKSSNYMYLFDFDGTLVGSDDWVNYSKNAKLCFEKLHFSPTPYDIRWSILTSRPKIDYPLIKLVCRYYKLYPDQIITSPTWLWKFKNIEQEIQYKEQVIKKILDNKFQVSYTKNSVDTVLYIDNNDKIVVSLNRNRGNYKYIAISISDLLTKNIHKILL